MADKKRWTVQVWVALLIQIVAAAPFTAYVGKSLWWWFAVPLGAPALSMWHMLGLMFMWSWWKMRKPGKSTLDSPIEAVLEGIMTDVVFLGLGAIVHRMMTP